MSLRASARPRNRSGRHVRAASPAGRPVRSARSVPSALASPKSVTQTVPWVSSRRFDGLMSRWTIPCWWA